MRGAIRRPTRDGVLDIKASSSPFALESWQIWFLYPSIILPRDPAHSAGRTPNYRSGATFSPAKTHPKFHSIFEAILAPKMLPKASQNGAKIHPKSIFLEPSFSYRFFFILGRFFGRFSKRPTLDFTAICSTFVGCAIFRKVGKCTPNDLPKWSKMAPQMHPEAFKQSSKNEH